LQLPTLYSVTPRVIVAQHRPFQEGLGEEGCLGLVLSYVLCRLERPGEIFVWRRCVRRVLLHAKLNEIRSNWWINHTVYCVLCTRGRRMGKIE
jgi:hypothetical protein